MGPDPPPMVFDRYVLKGPEDAMGHAMEAVAGLPTGEEAATAKVVADDDEEEDKEEELDERMPIASTDVFRLRFARTPVSAESARVRAVVRGRCASSSSAPSNSCVREVQSQLSSSVSLSRQSISISGREPVLELCCCEITSTSGRDPVLLLLLYVSHVSLEMEIRTQGFFSGDQTD